MLCSIHRQFLQKKEPKELECILTIILQLQCLGYCPFLTQINDH